MQWAGSVHPLGIHPPGQTPPRQTPLETATEAGGMHPTGMLSCLLCILPRGILKTECRQYLSWGQKVLQILNLHICAFQFTTSQITVQ